MLTHKKERVSERLRHNRCERSSCAGDDLGLSTSEDNGDIIAWNYIDQVSNLE
jgi:hypothetical protein